MVRERGGGITPVRVVNLLKKEVAEKSILAVSRSTGLGLAAVGRYLKGIGEPTTATLQKLAVYFGVSVAWLRGGTVGALERLLEGLKIAGIDPATYNKTVSEKMGKECDYWSELVAGNALLNSEHPEVLCSFFGINPHWVMTGEQPTLLLLQGGGIVGTVTVDSTDLIKKYVDLSNFDFDDYMKECFNKYSALYKAFCEIPDENKEEVIMVLSARLRILSTRKE